MANNPILWMDYPDPDIIRVGDTYYMISTTMHFMPGGVILRSYDLVHWEIASYVFETLDNTPAQCLEDGQNIYGKGMWAASLRYWKGRFYVCFVANDTKKTYLYQADDIDGPWEKQIVEGFYHDCSLLFDDDVRIYIVYGNTDIYITELNKEMTAPLEGGLHRLIISDRGNDVMLGYEGAHIYKIKGHYYVFLIHWPNGKPRTQACFSANEVGGTYVGGDVLQDDMGFYECGVAQGGIVDTPDGDYYAMLFQDHGAVGRIPVLVPVTWRDGVPAFGVNSKVPHHIAPKSTRPQYTYEPLYISDSFSHPAWQWNHTPDNALWSITENQHLKITTDRLCQNVTQAKNTLTQRMCGPVCEATITIDGSQMMIGDVAGLCALQGNYGVIGLAKEKGGYFLVVITKTHQSSPVVLKANDQDLGELRAKIPWKSHSVSVKLQADFSGQTETATFYYKENKQWHPLGRPHQLTYRLDHFTGCRFGLGYYATKESGGSAIFDKFTYQVIE